MIENTFVVFSDVSNLTHLIAK